MTLTTNYFWLWIKIFRHRIVWTDSWTDSVPGLFHIIFPVLLMAFPAYPHKVFSFKTHLFFLPVLHENQRMHYIRDLGSTLPLCYASESSSSISFLWCSQTCQTKDFNKGVLVSVAFSQGIHTLTFSKQSNFKFIPYFELPVKFRGKAIQKEKLWKTPELRQSLQLSMVL